MPEQQSRRGVTVSGNLDLSQPFETPSVRFGTKGLNLKVSADLVPSDEYRVLTNALHHASGEVTGRPGLIELNHTDDIHSVRRITEADGSDWTRIWGVGQSVGIGKTTITELEGDFFGRPFSLVPYRPPLSNESWMYVTDRNKGRKVALDGTILPISLTAPTAVITATASPKEITRIVDFGPEDGTDGAAWTKNAGFDYSEEPIETVIPAANDFGGFDGGAIEFVAQPGTAGTDNPVAEAEKGYYSFWGLPLTRNLSVVGTETASDEDLIHLWVKFSHPFLTA
jgi:hypothetical protein